MDEDDDDDLGRAWIEWFLQLRGNEYFCEIDEDYISDKFNLTGLSADVPYYQQALEQICESYDDDMDAVDEKQEIDKSAQHLYGLIHARYILTTRGLQKMAEKFKKGAFGVCPRVLCREQPVLPVGLADVPRFKCVKLYCPRCEDVYTPRSGRHARMDGAYFGTTFPHLLLQVHPYLLPRKAEDRYIPRIFGFKIHPSSQGRQPRAIEGERHENGNTVEENGRPVQNAASIHQRTPQPQRLRHFTTAGAAPGSWGADASSP